MDDKIYTSEEIFKFNRTRTKKEKFIDFFKYTIWYNSKIFFYDLKWYFRNLKNFNKVLWNFRSFDHIYCVEMYTRSLELLRDSISNGNEERISANKKVNKINELIELLKQYDTYTDDADKDIGFFNYDLKWKKNDDGSIQTVDDGNDKERKEKYKQLLKKEKELEHEYKTKITKILFGQSEREIKRLEREFKRKSKEEPQNSLAPSNDENYNLWINVFDGSGCRRWWD